jgi:hypothetical protein
VFQVFAIEAGRDEYFDCCEITGCAARLCACRHNCQILVASANVWAASKALRRVMARRIGLQGHIAHEEAAQSWPRMRGGLQ